MARIAANPIVVKNWVEDSFNPGLTEISSGVTAANAAVSQLQAQAPNLGIIRTNTFEQLNALGDTATTVLTKGATAVSEVVNAIMAAGGGSADSVTPPTKVQFTLDGGKLEDGDVVQVDEEMFRAAAQEIKDAHSKIATACSNIKDELTAISEEEWQGESRNAVVQVINKMIGEGAAPVWAEDTAFHEGGQVTPWAQVEDGDLQSVASASLANTCNSLFAVLNNIKETDKEISSAGA